MIDIKVSLTIAVPGADMMSEEESSKTSIVEVKDRFGKVIKDKNGKVKTKEIIVPDPAKQDFNVVYVQSENKKTKEPVKFYTRRNKPARQVINMCREAYEHFISSEVPVGFKVPNDFEPVYPVKVMPLRTQAWKVLTVEQRLLWHLERTAKNFNGTVLSYQVLED